MWTRWAGSSTFEPVPHALWHYERFTRPDLMAPCSVNVFEVTIVEHHVEPTGHEVIVVALLGIRSATRRWRHTATGPAG